MTVTKERRRYDGTWVKQADVLVGDQYGCVVLVARNEQLDMVKEGTVITVRNCHANVVNEHLRLEVDKWGKIELSKESVTTVNEKNNLSDVEYELVNVHKGK